MKLQNIAKLFILIILASSYSLSKEYHIIAGSYSSKNNAEKMLDATIQKGISASIIESVLPKGKFYRVSIGCFASISEAKSSLSDLSNKLQQKNLWILTVDSDLSQTENAEQAKLEQERITKANAEQAKLEQEQIAKANAEQAKLEQERIAKANAEQAKLEQEQIAKANAEQAKLEQERIAKANAEQAKLEQERIAKANAEQAKLEQESKTTIISDEIIAKPQSASENELKKDDEVIQINDQVEFSDKLISNYPRRESEPENLNIADFLKNFKIIINTLERNDEVRMNEYIHPDYGFILTYQNSNQKEIQTLKSLSEFYESAPIQSNIEQIKKDFKTTRLSISKVGSLPTFDCEQMKFTGMGLFAAQIKYLENEEIKFTSSDKSNIYQSYLKVSDFEVVNSENKKIYSMYFTLIDGKWFLSMINMIPPCN